jgi:ubiquinone/menaquinone biosynthesis C-methylase UbiE
MSEAPEGGIEATGERLVPERQHGELVHAEHLVRYRLAAELARSRRALDAACGEGYGTAMLAAAGASEAQGVDVDEATIAHAKQRYPAADFSVADLTTLPFEDARFDLVVSFETIEHVPEPERALDELRRVLAEDGLLLISTPNKHRYLVENEFHEREFTHEEFIELLSTRFPVVRLLLQHNWNASLILSEEIAADSAGERAHPVELRKTVGIRPGEELYTLALCTASGELPSLGALGVAATVDEAHELAARLRSAEDTAAMWHDEWEKAKAIAEHWNEEYWATRNSIWWRMTGPLRRLARLGRQPRG